MRSHGSTVMVIEAAFLPEMLHFTFLPSPPLVVNSPRRIFAFPAVLPRFSMYPEPEGARSMPVEG
ncbi:MAG: hypothetical protein K0S36_1704, partial [Nitrosospira multiformis]|nr:hypothetical protein [Nitrosospira multiformis]